MKLISVFIFFFFSATLFSQTNEELLHKLNSLYNTKQYFRLKTEIDNNNTQEKTHQEYFNSLLYCVFNQPIESNILIDKLFSEDTDKLSDSMSVELLKCRLINNVNMFQYEEAQKTTDMILSKYKNLIKPKELEDYENSSLIWKAASGLNPQILKANGDTKIHTKKDLAGLINVKVNINKLEEDFIFDTGANFSTVSKTFANKLKLKFLAGKIDVGTSTDKKVKSEIAYADSLRMGNLIFTNVVFLVLPDEALTFAGGIYVINGIIGFPVIKEMKEISISENEIFIPMFSNKSSYKNMSLDGFLPLIETIVNSDTLIFSFDTGAKKTIMYYPYYEKYKIQIDSTYESQDIKIGGAGGDIVVKGFKLNKMKFQIASVNASMDNISLLSTHIKDNDDFLYGNLGGDFMNKYKKMKINFENMFVDFEN